MASNLCQHDEPAATWSCACSPVYKFCSTCLLTHVQSPSGPHAVSYSGQPGKFVCGLCKTMSDDPVSCRYPVSLCKRCIATYQIVGERHDIPIPLEVYAKEAAAAVPEGEAKRRAEMPEEALKQRAEHRGLQSLQAMLTEKRNDARQHLTQVLENINSFEEIIARALYLEDKLQETKDNLRITEATLAERTAEVQRLQGTGPAGRGFEEGQMERFSAMMGRMEPLIRDNERLMSENQHLTLRIQAVERQLADQQSLNQQIEQLSKEIAQLKTELQLAVHQEVEKAAERNAIQLQETLQDQLQETARLAAQKVSDVIPLVAHLEVDNESMDAQTIESLFKLPSLVISGQLQSAAMRHVTRVCLLFAKHLGPCGDMAKFSENIRKVLLKNSERGIALLQHLEEIYAKTKDYEAAKELLKGLMRLVGTAEFDDSISIASRFAKVLSLAPLCDFTLAVTHFFAKDDPKLAEWRQVLTGVPVEWTNQQLATENIGALAKAIIATKFDPTYLHLAKLIQAGRLQDPTTVLTFVGRAAKLLENDPPRQSLNAFIQRISVLLESASKQPQDEFRVLAERVFASIKLVKENATMSEITQLATLLQEMAPGKPNSRVTYRFMDSLPKFKTEKKLTAFAFGMLAWMFPLGQPKADLKFADAVLSQLDQSRSFEDSAQVVGAFLSELSKTTRAPLAERCFADMTNLRMALEKVTEFCLALLTSFLASPAAAEVELFLQIWIQLLENYGNLVEVTDRVIALMKGGVSESILQTLKCFRAMKRRNLPAADSFAKEAIIALGVASERQSLNRLLHDLLSVMEQGNQPHDLAGKAVAVWMRGKARLPGDLYTYSFCSYVLQQLKQEQVSTLLDDFLALLNQENAPYSVAYRLAEISVIDASPPAHLSRLLKILKELRGGDALSGLFAKLATLQLQTAPRALFLRIVFDFVTKKPAEVQELARTLLALLNRAEAIPLLQTLAPLAEFGLVCDILDAARSSADPNTVAVGAQLASMFKACEVQGVREVALSPNLKTALLQRCADIAAILPHLQRLLQNPGHRMAALCARLMTEIASRGPDAKELLCFIAEKSAELLTVVQPDVLTAFWGVALDARDPSQVQTLKQLQSGFAQLKDKFVELLNRLQGRATLGDVDGLMPKHTQSRELVNVQSSLIRFFNFQAQTWNQATPLRRTIQCDSNSSYVILDDGKVFACGGDC